MTEEKKVVTGPYQLFKTDEVLETQGTVLNYSDIFKIKIARAGGANKKYARIFEAKTRPHRRSIQAGTLDASTDRRIMAEVYAESVILSWSGMTDADGAEIPFTKENVVKVLLDLPDLFNDITEQANRVSAFRNDAIEVDAKN